MKRTRTTAPTPPPARACAFRRAAIVAALSLLAISTRVPRASAQLIAVRTFPLPFADGDQFSFFPSSNLGMAGVSIAVADSLHDAFVNPAKGGRGPSYFFGAPTLFSVSRDAGGGSTLPVGVLARSGAVFGGAAAAIQSISDGGRPLDFPEGDLFRSAGPGSASHSNRYGFVMAGRSFASSKLSIGASALWSALGAIDGVSMLYPGSRGVNQSGGTADVRLGMLKEWNGGQSLEALVLHRRVGMTNDVLYADLFWDPVARQPVERARLEHDADRTKTWGIHFQYERPLADSGWRVGARLTANRLAHPAMANYEIASLPSDEGRTMALNLGMGLARTLGGTTMAIDAIYEPIRSNLRAVADSAVPSAPAGTIEAGGTTMDSRLRFSNVVLRAGVSQSVDREPAGSLRFQLGLQARSVSYAIRQRDQVVGQTRRGSEAWMEWTRSWGMTWRFPALAVHYAGRLTSGGARPGVANVNIGVPVPLPASEISRAPFPSASLTTMTGVRVLTHQLSLSVPLR
jgi:hypothetical protein